jgi:hypothetical protein
MNLVERRTYIAARREAQAKRSAQTQFEDLRIAVGPLTSAMCNQGRWRAEETLYPHWQVYADEIESVLRFAEAQHQLERYWPRLTARKAQRDSALDEIRIAYYFHRNEFEIVEWEPVGQHNRMGEYLVRGPSNVDVFVEVKGPRWEGELKPWEIQQGRTKQPKDLDSEARWVSPRKRIQIEIDKAYGKFAPTTHNLLVIAGYRGFMALNEIQAREALYNARLSGYFTTPAYENLGGVGIFSMGNHISETAYEMSIFLNPVPFARECLPADLVRAFCDQH